MFVEGPEREMLMWVARSLAIGSSCRNFKASKPLVCLVGFFSVHNENLEMWNFLSQTIDSGYGFLYPKETR